jgi:STE24 endopeptidase
MGKGITLALLTAICVVLLISSVMAQDSTIQMPADSAAGSAQLQSKSVNPDTAVADTIYPITPERRAMLNKYSDFKIGWDVFYEILQWLMLLAILYWGVSGKLQKYCESITQNRVGQFFLFLLFYLLLTTFITFPFDYYRNFVVEHQYGFANQSFGAWIGDQLKSFAVVYIAMLIIVGILYWLLRKFPTRWWWYFAIGFVPMMVISIIIVPVFVSPLFNKFEPLKDQELKTEILSLANKAGIEGADVFQVDASRQSNKLNAYVTGLWNTKRIVLYDTIIKAMTRPELDFVMAHEMGHYVMNHVWIFVGIMSVIMFIVLWIISIVVPRLIARYHARWGFDNLASYASFPLITLAISVIMFFIQPLNNGISRQFEHASDKYSMEMTGYNGEAAAVAFEKLSAYNLSNPEPSRLVEFWFYDHPALSKRINFVKEYGKLHGNVPKE